MYTQDGINFTKVVAPSAFSKRAGLTTTVFKEQLISIGGSNGLFKNDIWIFD